MEVDIEAANTEHQNLVDMDLSSFDNNIESFWKKVSLMKNDLNEPLFPQLITIVKIILILPHSSSAEERGFSEYSLIKTKLRNRLNVETCAAIVKDALKAGTWEPPNNVLRYNNRAIEEINVN